MGIHAVVALARGDHQVVAFGAHAVGNHNAGQAGGGEVHADAGEAIGGGVRQGHDVRIAIVTEDGHGVGGPVVGDGEPGLLDRLAAFGVVHELGAGAHHVLAGAQCDETQARSGHVVQRDFVAPGAAIETQVLKVRSGDGPRQHATFVVGDLEAVAAQRVDAEIVHARRTHDLQDVGTGAAAQRAKREIGIVPVNQVVATVAVHLVDTAAPVDIVIAAVAVDHVVAKAAEYLVAALAAVDLGRAGAVVHDVVHAGATVQEGVGAVVAGGEIVVAGIAIQGGLAGAVVDEDVVAVAAVELDVRTHALPDIDVVIPGVAKGHQFLHALEDRLAPAEDHAQGLAAGVRPYVFDLVELVPLALGDAAVGIAVAHVQHQHAVGRCRIPQA